MEMTRDQRITRVANGIAAVMTAVSDRPDFELTADDKTAIREIAIGVIKIWDGLNAQEVEG